jgi:hypothetical protein
MSEEESDTPALSRRASLDAKGLAYSPIVNRQPGRFLPEEPTQTG